MTPQEKIEQLKILLEELKEELQCQKSDNWQDKLKKMHRDCYFIWPNGDVDKMEFNTHEKINSYQTRELAEFHSYWGEFRKVAMSFEGYNENGRWKVYKHAFRRVLSIVNSDVFHLDSIAAFEEQKQAEAFIEYCKQQGKLLNYRPCYKRKSNRD